MNRWSRFLMFGVAFVASLVLAACGGSGDANPAIGTNGDNLAFDKATLIVPAGQQVSVAFKNNAGSQQHNWVLVKGGDDAAQQVDEAAAGAPDNIPDDPNIVAHTALLGGGQSGSASFTLPAGTYTYICTVPGHYPAMKGTLTVQ